MNKQKEIIVKDVYKRIKKYKIILCVTQTFKTKINEIQVLSKMEKLQVFLESKNINGFGCGVYEGYGNNFHIHSLIGINDVISKKDDYIKLFRNFEKGGGINDCFEYDFDYYERGNCWIRYMLKQNLNISLFYTENNGKYWGE